MRFIFLGLIFLSFSSWAWGQEEKENMGKEEFHPQIRVALVTINSHVPNAIEGDKKVAILPAWGFDVDYFFNPRWSVAIQADIKLQSFEVESEGALLERSYPLSIAPVLHYHFKRHWSLYAGPGWEYERNENLFFWKLGTEYSFEITEDFEIALNLSYENKQEIYDSWNFGIAFNKRLWVKD
ncbi:MAG: hypothetical protein HWE15_15465 [Algoriphagus sp.]|uniref:hypothetical protein n=1 Tax=Algoriphagus sp. TaxID=1872435 RepID=UPI0017C00784|nr:hypothetical protein [Algoriphagus sp.]NVJ87700.1 hypothetical protein [Algoriphagus sp.]